MNIEIPFKQWIYEKAIRTRRTPEAVYMRVYRGKYPHLKLRRVNQRVIFVTNHNHEQERV